MREADGRKLVGRTIAGYELTDFAGCGVSAAVYRASKGGQTFAFKLFEAWASNKERIERQLRLKNHKFPYLVGVIDGGSVEVDGNQCGFLVMDFVEGEDVRSLVRPEPRLDDPTIRKYLLQLVGAVEFLHQQGLTHRDIKPDNVRIRLGDSSAVLLDVGVIAPIGDAGGLTDAEGREFVGTRRYAPPEFQHRREEHDLPGWEAVAVYQLGAVLYELIHGVRLFPEVQDKPPADLVVAVNSTIPIVRRSDVGRDLLQLCRQCLEKAPERRPKLQRLKEVLGTKDAADGRKTNEVQRHIDDSRARFEAEVGGPRAELERRRAKVDETYVKIGELIQEEGRQTGLPNAVMHALPNLQSYLGYVLTVPEDLASGFATSLRIVFTVDVKADLGTKVVAYASHGEIFQTPIEESGVLTNQGLALPIVVWDGTYESNGFRDELHGFIELIAARWVEITKPTFERRLQDAREEIATKASQATSPGVVVRARSVREPSAFDFRQEMHIPEHMLISMRRRR